MHRNLLPINFVYFYAFWGFQTKYLAGLKSCQFSGHMLDVTINTELVVHCQGEALREKSPKQSKRSRRKNNVSRKWD